MTNDWRPIPSTPSYIASATGNIRHKDATKARNPKPDKRGYLYVTMWIAGKFCNRTIHSLIAEAFHGPRPEGAQVHGRTCRGNTSGTTKLSDDDVATLRIAYKLKIVNQYQAAVMFGISQAQVNNIVLNKQRVRAA
jgi:NUMOD4 motif-containing protein